MIGNIANYKIILFDFDDTLCIHSNHKKVLSDIEYNRKVIAEPIEVVYSIDECEPNAHMKEFMDYAHSCGVGTFGLLSSTMSFQHMQRKTEWVTLNYGYVLENFSVGHSREKADMVKAIAEAMNLEGNQLLFIDDFWDNIESVSSLGFDACSPMEIVNFVENRLRVIGGYKDEGRY